MNTDHAFSENVGRALQLIEEAQMRLYAAARALSPVPGLADYNDQAVRLADRVKGLWDQLERNPNARLPGKYGSAAAFSANVYQPEPPPSQF